MKVIETIGLPGSGKSTLTPIVKRALQEKGVQTFDATDIVLASRALPARGLFVYLADILSASLRRNMLRGLTRIFGIKPEYQRKFASEYPELFSYVRNHIDTQNIPDTHKLMMKAWFLNLAAFYMISQESPESGVIILEEGFAHKALTFFVAADDEHTDDAGLEAYLDLIPMPDILLKIAVDVDTCRQRLNGRALPRRLRGREEQEIFSYLCRAESVLEQAEQIMTRLGCTRLTLDNTENGIVENGTPQIENAIRELDRHIGDGLIHAH